MTRAPSRPEQPAGIDALLAATSPPKGIHAVTIVHADHPTETRTTGSDPSAELFEIGSVTKTITATLLAALVLDGQVRLDHTVGDLLGPAAGGAADVTMHQLATHTSGLPRLAPNAYRRLFWTRDPYRFYRRRHLDAGLADVGLDGPGKRWEYSNLGYQLLGECLRVAAGEDFASLVTDAVLRPAGMRTARCQPCPRTDLVRGHGSLLLGGRRWHQPLPGAGGVDASIVDLAAWTRANLVPDSTPLGPAIRLAHQAHATDEQTDALHGLAWLHRGAARWHNGGTGAFSSMIAVDPATGTGYGVLVAHAASDRYTPDGFILTALGPT